MSDLNALEQQFGLPPGLLSAVQQQESGGNSSAVSSAGALGAFQFMPATAQQYGIDPTDPEQAATGAAQMYADLLDKYKGDVPSALAAYNWGQGNLDKNGLANAPKETTDYIQKVMSRLPDGSGGRLWEQGNKPVTPIPWGVPGGEKPQQSVMQGIMDFIVPSAHAEENSYDHLTDDQLLAEAQKQGIPTSQPTMHDDIGATHNLPADQQVQDKPTAGTALTDPKEQVKADVAAEDAKNPYDNLTSDQLLAEAKKQGIPVPSLDDTSKLMGTKHQEMLGNAQTAMGPQGTLFGVPASVVGYGANAIKGVPGLSEAGSALAAMAHAGQGNTFGERYNNLEQAQQAMREASQRTQPRIKTPSYLPDITPSGIGRLSTGLIASPALPTPGPSGSYLGAFAKGAATGGLYGAAYGADETNSFLPGPEAAAQRASNIPSSAGIGALAGGIFGGASHGLGKIGASDVVDTSQKAQAVANDFYKQADQTGENFPPSFTNDLIKKAEDIAPQTLAGKATTGSSPIEDLAKRWQVLKDKPLDMRSIQEMDEGLGDLIDREYDKGRISKQGKQLLDLQRNFRTMISDQDTEGGQALSNARLAWKQAMKLGDLERIQTRADLADNPATMIKSGIRTLLSNPSKSKWYSADEIAALKQAADRGVVGGIAHVFGSRLLPMGAALIGEAGGGIPGAILGGAIGHGGTALMRGIGTGIQNSRMANAMQTIGQKVPKP